MWAELVRDRGGLPLEDVAELNDADLGSASFACAIVEDEGLLPLVARVSPDPPRLLLKAGRVGGPEGEQGSLAIEEAHAVRAHEVIASPVEGVDEGLLLPRFLYRRADRVYEYAAAVPELRAERPELFGAAPPHSEAD